MVDEAEARTLADNALRTYADRLGEALELVGDPDVTSRCLVFYWARSSGAVAAPGVGPIAVELATGKTHFLSSVPLEVALEIAGLA